MKIWSSTKLEQAQHWQGMACGLLTFLASSQTIWSAYPKVYNTPTTTLWKLVSSSKDTERASCPLASLCVLSFFFSLVQSIHLKQDNFAHNLDIICYDHCSLEPYQALITVNANGDYGTYYTHIFDLLIASFLDL